MHRHPRKQIALATSFLMVALLFCQGMALAASQHGPRHGQAAAASCHAAATQVAADNRLHNGDADCQHLVEGVGKTAEVMQTLTAGPYLTGFWSLPDLLSSRPRLAAFFPPDAAAGPPLTLRFQRFRE